MMGALRSWAKARSRRPHFGRIHGTRGIVDWNTYALVVTVELARGQGTNPDVPDWAREAYQRSQRELAENGLSELPRAEDPEAVRSILGLLALVFGARAYARILIEFSEDEILELEEAAFGSKDTAE